MRLVAIQEALRDQGIEGWLFYDHHHRDPIAYRILGLGDELHVTRRWYYLIPAQGEPRKLVHRIESGHLDPLPGEKQLYSTWQELEEGLRSILSPYTGVAMQYSPRNAIMCVSTVDAGTVELVRSFGKNVVTSADLVSRFAAVLTADQVASHYHAQERIDRILVAAWQQIRERVRSTEGGAGRFTEYHMVTWLEEAMRREGLVWESSPDVSVNANTASPHYTPSAEAASPIRNGDFLLIDVWGHAEQPGACFYDITWTGVVGRAPTEREQQIFRVVADARDAVVRLVEEAFHRRRPLAGCQADDAARAVIGHAGFGPYFVHRTGHNIGSEIHGNGANLDNLETHDDRLLLPETCFSVEPGIYLPEFGVRSEVNMIAGAGSAKVTGAVQTELVHI